MSDFQEQPRRRCDSSIEVANRRLDREPQAPFKAIREPGANVGLKNPGILTAMQYHDQQAEQ